MTSSPVTCVLQTSREVDKFATATFKSTGIEKKEIAGSSHLIKGELGMRGVTKAIVFPANVSVGEGR